MLIEHHQAIEQAAVEVLGRLRRAIGRRGGDHDALTGLHALGERMTVGVGLPRAERREARLGRVPLGLSVADEVDLVGDVGSRLGGRGDLLVPVVLRHRLLEGQVAVAPQRGRSVDRALLSSLAEPPEVQWELLLVLGLRAGAGAVLRGARGPGPALQVAREVHWRVGSFGSGESGRLIDLPARVGSSLVVHRSAPQLCTVRNSWSTAPS